MMGQEGLWAGVIRTRGKGFPPAVGRSRTSTDSDFVSVTLNTKLTILRGETHRETL